METKLENYFIKIKLRRNSEPDTLDMYEFKMTLFENGKPEEFLLFLQNFKLPLMCQEQLQRLEKFNTCVSCYVGKIYVSLRKFWHILRTVQTLI